MSTIITGITTINGYYQGVGLTVKIEIIIGKATKVMFQVDYNYERKFTITEHLNYLVVMLDTTIAANSTATQLITFVGIAIITAKK